MNEGFRIYTTIDSDLQKAAEDSLRTHLDQAEQHSGYNHQTYAEYAANFRRARAPSAAPVPDYLQGAVIALDNATGGVLALVGGRDFEHNQYDRALQARRPAGTAMTPFVFAAAFEKGMFPGSVVEDSPLDNRAVMIGGTTGILGEWGPETAGFPESTRCSKFVAQPESSRRSGPIRLHSWVAVKSRWQSSR